jgi:transglutaminase-like putative cysteine protease
MTFGRQKRTLLGLLALLAPLPLPFNGVASWLAVLLFEVGVAAFLMRAARDPQRWLAPWAMNVLGLLYLPFFFFDLLVLGHGRPTQAVVQLGLFAVLVKLFALVRERDKWQAVIGIFFIFLAAMGTSLHPTIVLYLLAFLVISLLTLTRFTFLHVLAGFGREDPKLAALPLRGFLGVSTGFVVLVAIPLFALLPRVRQPFIVGRGPQGTGSTIEASGFSDAVNLDSIGTIRNSRAVVMRVQNEGGGDTGQDLRFKAATFEGYDGGSWRRTPAGGPLERSAGARFELADVKPVRWIHVWLQPLHSRSLPLPIEAAVVEPRTSLLDVDRGGAVSFAFSPLEVREYRVGLTDRPVLLAAKPTEATNETLDLHGVTPRIAALARRLMGNGAARDRVRRLEQGLMRNYSYTLDFQGRNGANPIEDFLFRYRSGQCEYFASAMVLMLRSQGIPARLVTGFLGGEFNPFEGYYVVRDSNAHAWVEAYLGTQGWEVFDPTPSAGRPLQGRLGFTLLMQQAWDTVLFRWDRYVLTYGIYDQIQVFGQIRNLWERVVQLFTHRPETAPQRATAAPSPTSLAAAAVVVPGERSRAVLWTAIALLTLLAAVGLLIWRLRPPLTAVRAYLRILRELRRGGVAIPASAGPLAVRSTAAARFPSAAAPTGKVIDFYLRESYGGCALGDDEKLQLAQALLTAERELRRVS